MYTKPLQIYVENTNRWQSMLPGTKIVLKIGKIKWCYDQVKVGEGRKIIVLCTIEKEA